MTGGTAALVNIGARVLLNLVMPFEAAVLGAYLIGMATAYVLARLFVFAPSGQSVPSEFLRFGLVNVVGLVQVWLVSVGLLYWLLPAVGLTSEPELVAHAIGVMSTAVTSYYAHKLFTFRPRAGG